MFVSIVEVFFRNFCGLFFNLGFADEEIEPERTRDPDICGSIGVRRTKNSGKSYKIDPCCVQVA